METRPDSFLEQLYLKNKLQYAFNAQNTDEWDVWRHNLRSAFSEALGINRISLPEGQNAASYSAPDLDDVLEESVHMPGYMREKVRYNTVKGLKMTAYVLTPDVLTPDLARNHAPGNACRLPAVIACHGHGYGGREIIGLTSDGHDNSSNPGYQKNFAIELVKRGYLVIVPEIIGFGDRRLSEDSDKSLDEASCYRLSVNLLMLGLNTAGLRVYETMRTLDYLTARGDVDADRIGCMGISGGGLVCGFTSALDERIKVSVVSGFANTFKDSIMSMYHCIDNFIPGLLKLAEMPDILGLIAPRPLLIEAGRRDELFPIDAAHKAYASIGKVYSLLDGSNRLDMDEFEGEHRISGQKAYDWFEKWL